jgi:hypothetical protein
MFGGGTWGNRGRGGSAAALIGVLGGAGGECANGVWKATRFARLRGARWRADFFLARLKACPDEGVATLGRAGRSAFADRKKHIPH